MSASLGGIIAVNALIKLFLITTSIRTQVFMEYEPTDGFGPLLRTPLTEQGKDHEVYLYRLYLATSYQYSVFTTDSNEPELKGTFQTGTDMALPPALRRRISSVSGDFTYDLGFGGVGATSGGDGRYVYAWDTAYRKGEIVWFIEVEHLPSTIGTIIQEMEYLTLTRKGVDVYAPTGDLLLRYETCSPPHHDLIFTDDGVCWTLGYDSRDVQHLQRRQVGDTVMKIDMRDDSYEVLLSIFDFFPPEDDRTDSSDDEMKNVFPCDVSHCDDKCSDWSHGNSVIPLSNSSVLISFRHLNKIAAFKFDRNIREWTLDWEVGGEASDFDFPSSNDIFYHQHGVTVLDNGNLLMFDNGNNRPRSEGGEYTRALEIRLDFTTKEATKVWEFVVPSGNNEDEPCYCASGGAVVREDDGSHFIHVPDCYGEDHAYTLELDGRDRIKSTVVTSLMVSDLSRVNRANTIGGEVIVEGDNSQTADSSDEPDEPEPADSSEPDEPESSEPVVPGGRPGGVGGGGRRDNGRKK